MPVTCLIHRFGGQEVLRKDGQDPTESSGGSVCCWGGMEAGS